ncbi:MAG: NUDIX hydrolase N-terminal domain-containing protein [Candidatus Promineifilaceae bacterium]
MARDGMQLCDAQVIAELARELRAIAAFGLNFAGNPYDEERFEAILSVSARLQSLIAEEDSQTLLQSYRNNAFALSAMPSVETVLFDRAKILLVRRKDDGLWALPGGITDPGETLAESALRELREETGISGVVRRLLGIYDSRLWHSDKRIHFYHVLFQVESQERSPRPNDDVVAARYFAEDELPPLSPGHHLRVPFAFRQRRGQAPVPFFDGMDLNSS